MLNLQESLIKPMLEGEKMIKDFSENEGNLINVTVIPNPQPEVFEKLS